MAEVRALLQRCDPVLLDPLGDAEQLDSEAEASRMVQFLTDRRRVQKVLWRQLFVLDSMMSLLEGLESAQQLMTRPCPPQPAGGARSRWKALKSSSSRCELEETETLLRSLQDRVQRVQERKHTLTQLLQQLTSKKQLHHQLEESLLTAHNALQSCDRQLVQLRAESEAELQQLLSWQRIRDELQASVAAAQSVMQVKLLSFSQSELSVELRPRLPSQPSANELEPLRLSVAWSHDDRFTLQVSEGAIGLDDGGGRGRRAELSAALLEVMQGYVGQAELLTEIQSLRSSFAIDWRPAQRLLVYLKSALLVCHLEVEEGYPGNGRARLLSVRRDGQHVDTSGLKPHRPDLRLTEWLVFLCSSPLL